MRTKRQSLEYVTFRGELLAVRPSLVPLKEPEPFEGFTRNGSTVAKDEDNPGVVIARWHDEFGRVRVRVEHKRQVIVNGRKPKRACTYLQAQLVRAN
jgi:hypothetical protein